MTSIGRASFDPWTSSFSTSVCQTQPYDQATSTLQLANGSFYASQFVAQNTITSSAIQLAFSTAGVGGTLFRAGLYTVASDLAMTLVARTSGSFSDCTTTGLVSLAFNTTGGYPATYAIGQGDVFAIGLIGTGATTAYGIKYQNIAVAPGSGQTIHRVKRALVVTGQTDCPTSVASTASWNTILPWAAAA